MKNKLLLFMSAAICLSLASCSSYKVTSKGRTIEPLVAPVYANLDIRPTKISYVYQVTYKKNAIVNEKVLCENAVYEALAQAKADILVAPTFKVEVEVEGRKYYTVTVTGYPADFIELVQEKQPMAPIGIEVKELKKDGAYLILDKDQNGYQRVNRIVGIESSAAPSCVPPHAPHHVEVDKSKGEQPSVSGKKHKKLFSKE